MTDISVLLSVGDAGRHVDEASELGYFRIVTEDATDAVGVVAHVVKRGVLCPVAPAEHLGILGHGRGELEAW